MTVYKYTLGLILTLMIVAPAAFSQNVAEIFLGDSTRLSPISAGQPVKVRFVYARDKSPVIDVTKVDMAGKISSDRYKVLLERKWKNDPELIEYVFDMGNYRSGDQLEISVYEDGDLLVKQSLQVRQGFFSLRGAIIGTNRLGIQEGLALLIRLKRFKFVDVDFALGASISATFQDSPLIATGKDPDDGKPRFYLVGFSLEVGETFDAIIGGAVWDRGVNRPGLRRNVTKIGYGGSVDLRFFKEIIGLLSGGII